eukprot:COSAG02_NODE_2194_length_9554_cov_12.883659_13_plen_168_part_00
MGVNLGPDEETYALEVGGFGLDSSSGSAGGLSGSSLGAALQQESSRLGRSEPSVDEIASSFSSLDAFAQSAEGVDAIASSEGSSGAPGSLEDMLKAEQDAIVVGPAEGRVADGGGEAIGGGAEMMPRHEGHRDELCQYHMAGAFCGCRCQPADLIITACLQATVRTV